MDLLNLPIDVIQLIVIVLDWRTSIKLSIVSKRAQNMFNNRFWQAKLLVIPKIENCSYFVKSNLLKLNAKAIKHPKNHFISYLINMHNYLLYFNDSASVITIINNICNRNVLVNYKNVITISDTMHSVEFLPPYFWKEVFINLNKYLTHKGEPILVDKQIDNDIKDLVKKVNLKYRQVCVEYIVRLKDLLIIELAQKINKNKIDIKLINSYLKTN